MRSMHNVPNKLPELKCEKIIKTEMIDKCVQTDEWLYR
jgi:hypothetical protein